MASRGPKSYILMATSDHDHHHPPPITKADQVEGGKCNDDASFNVWMRNMVTTERAEVQDSSHTNECIEEDRGSVLEGPKHKQRDSVEAGMLEVVKKRQEE